MPIDLAKLAADLREAKRYVRRDPDEAIRQTELCRYTMGDAWPNMSRLSTNLLVGIRHVRSCPEHLSNYLANAAFEVEILAAAERIEVEEPA